MAWEETTLDEAQKKEYWQKIANPKGLEFRNPPLRGLWETFGDRVSEMFDDAGEGINAWFKRSGQGIKEEQLARSSAQERGLTAEQSDQEVKTNQAAKASEIRERRLRRQIRDEDEDRRYQEQGEGGLHRAGRWVMGTLGDVVGDINPTYALPILGETIAARIAGQGAVGGATDILTQGAERREGIIDKGDAGRVVANIAGGMALQSLGEAAAKGVQKARLGTSVYKGSQHPAYDAFFDTILGLEGGGTVEHPRVNPKSGARGPAQVMPSTARDPGFGIRRSNGTPQDDVRVGKQYSAVLLDRYGDVDKALAAYNWGPGNVDNALRRFGDDWLSHAPEETRNYVQNGLRDLNRPGNPRGVRPMDPREIADIMDDPEAAGPVGDFDTPRYEAELPEDPDFDWTTPHNDGVVDVETEAPELPDGVTDINSVRNAKVAAEDTAVLDEAINEMHRGFEVTPDPETSKTWVEHAPGYIENLERLRDSYDTLFSEEQRSGLDGLIEDWHKVYARHAGALEPTDLQSLGYQGGKRAFAQNDNVRSDTLDLTPEQEVLDLNDEVLELTGGQPPRGPGEPPSEPPGGGGEPPGRSPEEDPWAGSVNLNRLAVSDGAKDLIRRAAADPRWRIQGHADTLEGAQRLLEAHNPQDLLSFQPTKMADIPAYQTAVRMVLASSSEHVNRLGEEFSRLEAKLAKGGYDVSAEHYDPVLAHRIEDATLLLAAAWERDHNVAGEAGRLLNARKIIIGNNPQGDVYKAIRRASLSTLSTTDLVKMIRAHKDHAGRIASDALSPDAMDKFMSLWYNWKLSGLATQTANLAGTASHLVLDMLSHAAAVPLGVINGNHDRVTLDEVGARVYGMAVGLKQAFTVLTGDEHGRTPLGLAFDIGSPLDMTSRTQSGRAFKGKMGAFEIPTRSMAAGDELFRNIAAMSHLYGEAFRTARMENLQGADFHQRVLDLTTNPTKAMDQSAVEYAKRMRFADEASVWTRKIENLRRQSRTHEVADWQSFAAFAARLMLPFMHTLDRLTAASVRHSPIGARDRVNAEGLAAGGRARELAQGRMLVGTALVAAAAVGAWNGVFTGGDKTTAQETEADKAVGRTPYSIHAGDSHYSIRTIQPVSTTIATVATAVEEFKKTHDGQAWSDTIANIIKRTAATLFSGAWTESVGNAFAVVDGRSNSGLANFLGSAFDPNPALLRQINSSYVDPVERDTVGDGSLIDRIKGRVESGIPGLSDNLPAKHDVYGEEYRRDGALGPDIASPIKIDRDPGDYVRTEIDRLSRSLGKPVINQPQTEKGVSAEDRQNLRELAGKVFYDEAFDVMTSEDFQMLTDEQKAATLKKLRAKSTKAAKKALSETKAERYGMTADEYKEIEWQ